MQIRAVSPTQVGRLSGGTNVANPPGTLTISGDTLTFLSTDGNTSINAGFTNSKTVETCYGRGRGGHVTIAVDASGMVLVGGGGAQIVDNMTGVLASPVD